MATRLLASIIVLLTFAGCVPNTMHHSNIGKCDSELDPKNREKVKIALEAFLGLFTISLILFNSSNSVLI